jgi:hypothetical protein
MFIQAPVLRQNGTLTKGNKPNKIILHHPVFNGTPQQLNEMEITNKNDPMIMSGYNYYVRKDGSTYAMRPTWAVGANCYGQNSQSIGVAAEGNFMVDTMLKAQENAIIILCKYLMQSFPDIKEVGPHKKYSSTDCPGKNYPVNEVINAISSKTPLTPPVATTMSGVVNATTLNVRSGQGTTFKIIGTLKKGAVVKIGKNYSNGWSNIYFGAHGGFVSTKYIK